MESDKETEGAIKMKLRLKHYKNNYDENYWVHRLSMNEIYISTKKPQRIRKYRIISTVL